MKKGFEYLKVASCRVWVSVDSILYRHANLILFLLGTTLLLTGLFEIQSSVASSGSGEPVNDPIDTEAFRWGVCQLYNFIEGDFGALLATVAGVLAIVASSVGSYSSAYTLLTVALGCFILRALVSMWFGSPDCGDDISPIDIPSVEGDNTGSLDPTDLGGGGDE